MLLSASFLNADPFLSCISMYRWTFIKQILLKQRAYLFILTSKNCPKNFQTTVRDCNLFLDHVWVALQYVRTAMQIQKCFQDWTKERTCSLTKGDVVTTDTSQHPPSPSLQRGAQSIQHPWTPPPRETNGRSESSNERLWQAASCTSLIGIITTACRTGYKTPKSLWAPFWPFVLSSPISQVPRHYMVNLAEPSTGWKSSGQEAACTHIS